MNTGKMQALLDVARLVLETVTGFGKILLFILCIPLFIYWLLFVKIDDDY
jgi:hypothetical protein